MSSVVQLSDATQLVGILGLLGVAGAAMLGGGIRIGLSKALGRALFVLGCILLAPPVVGATAMLFARIVLPTPPPSFEVGLLNSAGSVDPPRYEVTNQLVWASGASKNYSMDNTGVSVRAVSVPPGFGSLQVSVLNADGAPLLDEPSTWIPEVDGLDLPLKLSLSQLISASGLKTNQQKHGANVFENALALHSETAELTVRVTRLGTGDVLAEQRVALVNTPYYHTTTVSNLHPSRGGSVTAYVGVRNLGAEGNFNLVCNLWRVDSSVRFEPDWGIGSAWQRLGRDDTVVTEGVAQNERFTAECTLPGPNDTFVFDEPGFFALETYVVKQQPYAYPTCGGGFFECDEKWLFADPSDVFLLIVK